MTQSLKDFRRRLKELVGIFKYESENSKESGRKFYRLTKDLLDHVEALQKELDDLRQPKLGPPPSTQPRVYTSGPRHPPVPDLTRPQRIRAMISGGPHDPATVRALKWMRLTWEEAQLIVESEPETP